jgi:hypothetical protein
VTTEQLSVRMRCGLVAGLIALVVAQVSQLFLDPTGGSNWPLCSYNMFAYRYRGPTRVVSVVLAQDDGTLIRTRPGNVLPIEFFRANALVKRVFVHQDNLRMKDLLSSSILDRLRDPHWAAFDEVWAPVRPNAGQNFTGLAVDVLDVLIDERDRPVGVAVVGAKRLYRSPKFPDVGDSTPQERRSTQ